MSDYNFKFTSVLFTASIALVFLSDGSIARHIRSPAPWQLPVPTIAKRIYPSYSEKCESRNEYIVGRNKTCDCRHTDLRYIENDWCYPPYTQGPCEKGKYLVPTSSKKLTCADNSCGDNKVPHEGSCYSFDGTSGPCGQEATLQVDFDTYELACVCDDYYWPFIEDNRCYRVGSQGPCEEGKIIAFGSLSDEKVQCFKTPTFPKISRSA